MTPIRVLLVEDDLRFAIALTAALHRTGYHVDHRATMRAALSAPPGDLILLDLGLPDGHGIDLCRRLRRESDVGIIVLTARGDEPDRVAGLRGGADDYVVKPFSFAELQARMESVLRRSRPRNAGRYAVGDLRVDVGRHLVTVSGEPVALTPKEFRLLAALVVQPGSAVSREDLLSAVWRTSWVGRSRSLDVHMAALRGKIGRGARIETIRGVGYRLMAADRAES